MPHPLGVQFVNHAADILAETSFGLSGPQILKVCSGFAIEWGVNLPHQEYPFDPKRVPNKRTALANNLMAFSEPQRYQVIRELCEHSKVRELDEVKKLKLTLVARYGHLAGEALGAEVDQALVESTQHWLGPFPLALRPYEHAVQLHASDVFLRHVLDDLRLALELLLKSLLGNDKSLENQIPQLGQFIKSRGGSPELGNMFVKLIDYYTKYQNSYIKHDDAVIDEEVEFILELTSSFMKHLVRLSYKDAV